MSNKVFLPDPLSPNPKIPEGMEVAKNSTIEDARRQDLEDYRQLKYSETKEEPLKFETETKEEPSPDEVQHDVAVAEAMAGKIKLSTVIPVKTIRLDVEKFTAFYDRKFYRVKVDYDLFFEVNAKNQAECVEKILKFIQSQLKGMLETTEEDMQISEFVPNMRKGEEDTDYSFD